MVKPDGVQRALIGDIIKRFEQKGFKLVAMKFMQVGLRFTLEIVLFKEFKSFVSCIQASKDLLEKHYGDLKTKPFFNGLVKFMSTGPVCAMVCSYAHFVELVDVTFNCMYVCMYAHTRCGKDWEL